MKAGSYKRTARHRLLGRRAANRQWSDRDMRARTLASFRTQGERKRRSLTAAKNFKNPEWKNRWFDCVTRAAVKAERRKRLSRALMGHTLSSGTRAKISSSVKRAYESSPLLYASVRRKRSLKTRLRLSRSRKRWCANNPEKARKQVGIAFAAMVKNCTPNRQECLLATVFAEVCPGFFTFNVNGRGLFIGNKRPDFRGNGKCVAEMFGTYWHGRRITGRSRKAEEQRRKRHFAKYGYRTLIVWEDELRDRAVLERKIRTFMRKENYNSTTYPTAA